MYPYGLGNFGDFSYGGFETEVCEVGVSGNWRLISARKRWLTSSLVLKIPGPRQVLTSVCLYEND
jgi:hypothetical protein